MGEDEDGYWGEGKKCPRSHPEKERRGDPLEGKQRRRRRHVDVRAAGFLRVLCNLRLVHVGTQAGVRDRLEEFLHFRRTFDKPMVPKVVPGIFYELYESDQKPPRVRSMNNESLQENPGDLLLHIFVVCVGEKVEQDAGKVVRVRVRVPQVVRDSRKKEVTPLVVEFVREIDENLKARIVLLQPLLPMGRFVVLWEMHADVEQQCVQQADVVIGVT